MRVSARILVLSIGFSLLMPFGFSQSREKKYRFELFGGGSYAMDKNFTIGYPQSTASIAGSHKFSMGAQGGARIGMDAGRHWGADYSYSFGTNSSEIVTQYGKVPISNKIHQAYGNAVYYPMSVDNHTVLPYLTAGVGATFATVSQETVTSSGNPLNSGLGQLKSETIFALNAGGGIRFRLNQRFGIRLDARDFMSRPLRYGIPKTSSNANQAVLPVSGVLHQISGTFGIVIHF
jgi:opacity protein-like surface antigen